MTKKAKKYWNMTAAELAEATQEFDSEHVAETFREMTPSEEKAWRKAVGTRRPPGQHSAKRVEIVSLGIETSLLQRADALAKKRGVSRARLITEGLEALLANGNT
jgi:hypothetical protein